MEELRKVVSENTKRIAEIGMCQKTVLEDIQEMKEANESIHSLAMSVYDIASSMKYMQKDMETVQSDLKESIKVKYSAQRVHEKLEETNEKVDEVLIMTKTNKDRIGKLEIAPMEEAYKQVKGVKHWLIGGLGVIVLTVVTAVILLLLKLN